MSDSAYKVGFKARRQGKPATDNPHRPLSNKWFNWADGWKDLDEHLRDRDEALRFTFGRTSLV